MPHLITMCENYAEFTKLHRAQLETSCVPEHFWPTLHKKLKNEVFDAGECFGMMRVEEEWEDSESMEDGDPMTSEAPPSVWQVVVTNNKGLSVENPDHIFLVDHAWTFRVDSARTQLTTVPGLLERMATLMDVEVSGKSEEDVIEEVFNELWRYSQTYNIGNASLGTEEACPIWYVMDEFGSRIRHSDFPNCRAVPIVYVPNQITFTILWPISDIRQGDEVTRNYVEPFRLDPLSRKMRLLPWQPEDFTHLSYELKESDESFYMKYKVHETLPNADIEYVGLSRDRNVRVWTDVDQVSDGLTDPRFDFVDSMEEADIIWTFENIKDFGGFTEEYPRTMLSQFPFEMVITVKDLLAQVSRRGVKRHIDPDTLETSPRWLPATFNLMTELPQFVSYFQHREYKELGNYWICKPYNLARSLDIHITNNLNYILRLPDTGPKIACKYIEEPVLIDRDDVGGPVKFDLRYVIMLESVKPLKAYVHHKFLLRVANKIYSLDHFDDFEKHFTVMNYKKGADIKEIECEEFLEMFEAQYPDYPWNTVETSIFEMIREFLEAATSKPPPKGIGHSPQSRTIYGIDVMLKWDTNEQGERYMQPALIECNFGPDCSRLIRYYPDFMNDVFSALFLNDLESRAVALL